MGRAPRAPRARRRLALLPVGLERAQGCALPWAEVGQSKP